MNRRNSILNSSSEQPQSSPNKASAQELPTTDFSSSCTTKDYDAAAAALSRLSVLSQQTPSNDSASPQLNRDSTYETTIVSACPSPKRGLEYFDESMDESSLKRLRRDSLQTPTYIDMSLALNDISSPSETIPVDMQAQVRGLGLESLAPKTPCSTVSYDENRLLSTVTQSIQMPDFSRAREAAARPLSVNKVHSRPRSHSAPVISSSKRPFTTSRSSQSFLSRSSISQKQNTCLEPLLRRSKLHNVCHVQLPPITQQTLRELELSEIVKNAQLRHDMVHDPDLQFRPNTDGERGAKKRYEANCYWQAIARELDEVQSMSTSALMQTRLSHMFLEMKQILLSLVPTGEKVHVEASFDQVLLMQTLNHGIFSPRNFSCYMSELMKRHCAPMRDDAIDSALTKLEHASTSFHFAQALRATFDILENMKLDVANHQLRTLRGVFLRDSVDFELSWFTRKFNTGVYARESSMTWFRNHCSTLAHGKSDYRQMFVNAFTSIFQEETISNIPSTFCFDSARIQAIHKDVRELVCLNVVLLLAKQMLKHDSENVIAKLKAELWALLVSERVHGFDKWSASIPYIALHLASKATVSSVSSLPNPSAVKFASAWLTSHLSPSSAIFSIVKTRVINILGFVTYNDLNATTVNGKRQEVATDWRTLDCTKSELLSVASRMLAIVSFHWKVHGQSYIQWSQ